jgi:hypothetical protein
MKKSFRKLTLSRESIRHLTSTEAADIQAARLGAGTHYDNSICPDLCKPADAEAGFAR